MSLAGDIRVLYHLAFSSRRGRTHEERLENFYRGQARDYDAFRSRLLQGRRELFESLTAPAGGVWVDMGGGSGSNAEYLGERLPGLGRYYVVDLCPSLLAVARERAARQGWRNVETIHADATAFVPPEGRADVVTFSYSLTMIPDWFAAIDHAAALLRPGGQMGVVDFHVSRRHPSPGLTRHGWGTRTFWPIWFAFDGVYLSPDHLPCLMRRFRVASIVEQRARLPYLPLLRVPYYRFVGVKS